MKRSILRARRRWLNKRFKGSKIKHKLAPRMRRVHIKYKR